jgi:tellurite resistance protein TerC
MLHTNASAFWWIGSTINLLLLVLISEFHRRAHEIKPKEAVGWTAFWVSLALLFNLGLYVRFGSQAGLQFLTGYLIEYSLSVDNIFVFVLIFRYFAAPPITHHRALFWGIVGAILLRGFFILAGTVLLQSFHWLIYVLGRLIFTGLGC